MLPVESFTDALSFLGYWDLIGLKLTSKLCSDLAHRCAGEIRIFDLSNVGCVVYVDHVTAFPIPYALGSACHLDFPDADAAIEFISEAFRNCILGGLDGGRRC